MEIIIATGNAGKVREFKRMLEPLGYTVFSQKEKEIFVDPEEDGDTFAENALIKARAVWEIAHTAVIADDSGLCVDALDGRPGVYSARYAGEGATDADRNRKLLAELEGVSNRAAHFTCAIAYIDAEGRARVFEGICPGTIGFEPKGADGFGYDPLFLCGEKTFGEMSAEEKDAVSHRGRANRMLEEYLRLHR
ncbi:MAG: RdgB/HAM1 family non-canonical purine NTP pyrophosphatase [Candidatus Merdivicinus sp.]|jgi:XTP/dITP diphosphohydrolase